MFLVIIPSYLKCECGSRRDPGMRESENRIRHRHWKNVLASHPIRSFIDPTNRLTLILPDPHAGVPVRIVDVGSICTDRFHPAIHLAQLPRPCNRRVTNKGLIGSLVTISGLLRWTK